VKERRSSGVLPVSILPMDDRIEKPEGVIPSVAKKDHPVTKGIDGEWPYLLGFNEVKPKEYAQVLATVGEYPLLVTGSVRERTQRCLDVGRRSALVPETFRRLAGLRPALARDCHVDRKTQLKALDAECSTKSPGMIGALQRYACCLTDTPTFPPDFQMDAQSPTAGNTKKNQRINHI
jgi:hypothetical protein